MTKFAESYTTNEKITKATPEQKKIEEAKTVLSNDAYAVGEVVEQFSNQLNNVLEGLRGALR